jgi:hypothetical protein
MKAIDPAKLGATWDHTIMVRGVEVPLLSPDKVDADECDHLPGGLIHLPTQLWARLRKILFGVTHVEHLRGGIAATFPPEFRGVARDLSGSELMRLSAMYQGLQQGWYQAIAESAMKAGNKGQGSGIRDQAAAERGGKHTAAPVTRPGPQMMEFRIRPGDSLPQALGGHATGRNKRTPEVIEVR